MRIQQLLEPTEHMLKAHTEIETNIVNNSKSFAFYNVYLKLLDNVSVCGTITKAFLNVHQCMKFTDIGTLIVNLE